MILDTLENAHRYSVLGKGFEKAFDFLTQPDLKNLPADRYEIDGDRVFATVVMDAGRSKDDAQLETHQKYIDIQLVLAGTDDMGWRPGNHCSCPVGAYNQEDDIQFFCDESDVRLSVEGGTFAIFFPEDAHMPMISSGQLHKIVVKIAVDQR